MLPLTTGYYPFFLGLGGSGGGGGNGGSFIVIVDGGGGGGCGAGTVTSIVSFFLRSLLSSFCFLPVQDIADNIVASDKKPIIFFIIINLVNSTAIHFAICCYTANNSITMPTLLKCI